MDNTIKVNDLLALKILDHLCNSGLINSKQPDFSWISFHQLRSKAKPLFYLPKTSITPIMARVLYGLVTIIKPRRILGIGTYMGNALLWIVGPYIDSTERFEYAYGVDIDPKATEIAKANFSKLSLTIKPQFITDDGIKIAEKLHKSFDLVYIDVEDERLGKSIYLPILRKIDPYIVKNGLVLAHDIAVSKFKNQLRDYLSEVRNKDLYEKTESLYIDYCGLEVTKK